MTNHAALENRVSGWQAGLKTVFLVAVLYSALHVGFRLLASSVLGEDDVLDNILVQEFRPGYDLRQPPLYDWVLWIVQRLTGPTLESFLLIKYAALIATAVMLYLAALRILKDSLWAILTVESLALIYQISWRYHEGFTHEVLAMVCVVGTLLAFLRLIEKRRPIDFVAFGTVAGIGFLTEPTYAVYLTTLLLSAALQPSIRVRVFRPWLAAALLIASVIASPFLLWILSNPNFESAYFRPSANYWVDVRRGLMDAVRGPILYLSPLLFILPAIFPGFLNTAWADLNRGRNMSSDPDLEQLVLHTTLIAVTLSAVGAVLFGIGGFAIHVLMPLYITSVIWLFGIAKKSRDSAGYVRRFAGFAFAIAVVALAARLANMFVLDPVCKKCRWGIPYEQLANEMRASGFNGSTIVAFEEELAGNLRQHFPEAKIVTRRRPYFTPAGAAVRQGRVAYVWSTEFSDAYAGQMLSDVLPQGQPLANARIVRIPWKHLWRPDGYRVSEWRLLIVDNDADGRKF